MLSQFWIGEGSAPSKRSVNGEKAYSKMPVKRMSPPRMSWTVIRNAQREPAMNPSARLPEKPIGQITNPARNARKWATFKPVLGEVNNREAMADSRSGEKPKRAILVPDATPI